MILTTIADSAARHLITTVMYMNPDTGEIVDIQPAAGELAVISGATCYGRIQASATGWQATGQAGPTPHPTAEAAIQQLMGAWRYPQPPASRAR